MSQGRPCSKSVYAKICLGSISHPFVGFYLCTYGQGFHVIACAMTHEGIKDMSTTAPVTITAGQAIAEGKSSMVSSSRNCNASKSRRSMFAFGAPHPLDADVPGADSVPRHRTHHLWWNGLGNHLKRHRSSVNSASTALRGSPPPRGRMLEASPS